MEQKELRELLLSLAAEAAAEYENALIDRNAKFEEIQMLSKKMEELKVDDTDSVFSPRNSLSKYDAKLSLEKDIEKEKLELDRLDSICDSFLNRKEELISAVELFDELCDDLETQIAANKELMKKELTAPQNIPQSTQQSETSPKPVSDNSSSKDVTKQSNLLPESSMEEDPLAGVDKKTLMNVIEYISHRTEDIAKYVLMDPGRARNELLALHNKIEF